MQANQGKSRSYLKMNSYRRPNDYCTDSGECSTRLSDLAVVAATAQYKGLAVLADYDWESAAR